MRVGYFDCFNGASGDMILGACIDAGLDLAELRAVLARLDVEGYSVDAQKVRKQGFAATQFSVNLDPSTDRPHRHLKHIRAILDASDLPEAVRARALAVFTRLAEAAAEAHGTTVDKVHFHEVGAIDSIVDIVGAVVAMDRLGLERLYCSKVPVGSGTVRCDHGVMPVPAPATAALLRGVPLADSQEEGELTTPTGAALLTTLSESFGAMPAMTIESVGVGAGQREGKTRPNILRLLIGELAEIGRETDERDEIIVLEANLDDVSAEVIGHVFDRLFEAGALDVFATPIQMKKSRPGTLLSALAEPARRDELEEIIFSETTTFGIRAYRADRRKLSRTHETVQTDFGPIRIKVGRRGDRVVTASPEFEDCREAAKRAGRPLVSVMEEALQAWRASGEGNKAG